MPRYFLELSYKGTNYSGWQIQDNAISVQQKINEALLVKLGEKSRQEAGGSFQESKERRQEAGGSFQESKESKQEAGGSGEGNKKRKQEEVSGEDLANSNIDSKTSPNDCLLPPAYFSQLTTGCGRTDTGVHATQFFAHFDTSEKITDEKDFGYRLNALLPFDISIHNIHAVADDAHARYDAVKRSYRYYIHTFKNGFLREYSGCYFSKFNLDAMNVVAQLFLQRTDFSSFCKAHAQSKTPFCKIYHAQWKSKNGLFIFEITADRFLRGMVRAMVGTMIDAGAGKTTLQDVKNILESKDRTKAGHAAPACGLYLTKIVYPYLEVEREFNFPFTI